MNKTGDMGSLPESRSGDLKMLMHHRKPATRTNPETDEQKLADALHNALCDDPPLLCNWVGETLEPLTMWTKPAHVDWTLKARHLIESRALGADDIIMELHVAHDLLKEAGATIGGRGF